jgi:phosphoserine phosphatase
MQYTTIYLARHAATPANQQQIMQGQGVDMALSDLGREQARRLGRFLSNRPIEAVYSSPLRRAVETAHAVAEHHELEISTALELREVDVGRWEGRDRDWIVAHDAAAYESFLAAPHAAGYPDGEKYSDVLQRARPVIFRIAERHAGGSVAVIAHSVVNRTLLADIIGISDSLVPSLRQNNACLNVLRWNGSIMRLVQFNASFHEDRAA